jgi:CTP:molybdopterin cytidylyltransferase MocA
MGRDKRRLPFRGATVLETTVGSLRQGGVSPVVVVLEPDSPCRSLPGLTEAILVVNPDPRRGMLSSIREGLRAVPPEACAAAVLPGDHPFVPPTAVAALLRFYEEHRPLLLAPCYAGRRGHPLILDRALFAEAAACDDAVGLRELLQRRAQEVLELPLDAPGAEDDLDRPEDLLRLEEKGERGP